MADRDSHGEEYTMRNRVVRIIGAAAIAAVLAVGATPRTAVPAAAAPMAMMDHDAGSLRVTLNGLLQEHAYLATLATGAALQSRTADFQAAVGALDANSVELSKAVGGVYGAGAEQAFLPLWRKHIGFFVDYTMGLAMHDKNKQDKAVNDLIGYTQDFGAFLSAANPNLPKDAVAELVKQHVLTLKAVVDAQAAGTPRAAVEALRLAAAHMQHIADPLAAAIAKQFPDTFMAMETPGATSLRVALNNLLREHAYLAALATGAALEGRTADFQAAAAGLDANSVDISKAVGSVYGAGAEQAFLPLWRKHIGFFVDYTTGAAMRDKAKQNKAVGDLIGYTQDFGAFLNSANPNLPKDAVASLVKEHVLTLKAVVDAQAARMPDKADQALRMAAAHMQHVADPLAAAIAKQFPDRF